MWLAALAALVFCSPPWTLADDAFTHVQYSNIYCTSRQNHPKVNFIVCDFNQTAARLGNVTFLDEAPESSKASDGRTLHLEISHCSSLWITSEFQTSWRDAYDQLELKITDVDDVVQDEIIEWESSTKTLINFSMRNSNMGNMYPNLISSTAALLVEISNSSIGFVTSSTFKNIGNVWQFRICETNISRFDSDAMSDFLVLAPPPINVHIEFPPFIFNETHFQDIEPDSIKLHVSSSEDYLNFVHSRFSRVQSRGLQIAGKGHVLFADSVITNAQDDSFQVNLQSNTTKNPKKFGPNLTSPTLTLMGMEIGRVNVTNFLSNLKVNDGKLYLMRINLTSPGALESIINISDQWVLQSAYFERIATVCLCHEIDQLMGKLDLFDETEKQIEGELDGAHLRAEEDKLSAIPLNPVQQLLSEIRCLDDYAAALPHEYHETRCQSSSTLPPDIEPITEEPLISEASLYDYQWFICTLGTAGISGFFLLVAAAVVQIQHKRRQFSLQKQTINLQQNKNQVGVLSEDPICAEDGDDEC